MKKREVEFRGWYIPEKRFFYGIERAYDYLTDCSVTGDTIPASSFGGILIDDDWIVEQFVGVLDANGKKIFEGDRCRVSFDGGVCEKEYIVVWQGEAGYFVFDLDGWDGESHGLSEANAVEKIEVVGNIYEGVKR
jgi:uncharacterized phage protein (TIGR01671 family)